MLKVLMLCALTGAPLPVLAGERDRPALPTVKALLTPDTRSASLATGRQTPLRPSYLPLRYNGVSSAKPPAEIAVPRESAPVRFAYAEPAAQAGWRLTDGAAQVTSTRGASYAVSDTLADRRQVRHRKSALSTMLVLRLDGKEESPAFSVGGGGVAAAVWKAVPQD